VSEGENAATRLLCLRTGPICFDATVPRHLARCGLGPEVLEPIRDRAFWPEAVALELKRAKVPNIRQVVGVGTEIALTKSQAQDADDLRKETLTEAQISEKRTINLGEAQCVVLCESRGWPLIVHDGNGQRWADRRAVSRFDVVELLAVLASSGSIRPGKAWQAYERLCQPFGEIDPDKAGMFIVPAWIPGDKDCHQRFMSLVAAIQLLP
jgi:hypothetical protein